MPFALRSGITYCEASGRLIFLDVPEDRYFCLDGEAEAAFRRTAAGIADDEPEPALGFLIERGILERSAQARTIGPAVPPAEPTSTLLGSESRGVPGWSSFACACAALVAARTSLRWRGLDATLRGLAASKREPTPERTDRLLEEVVRAFDRTNGFVSPLDQCLPRSVALARILSARACAATLVIGVRLRPFLAHSWVQSDGLLLNDRPDVVRSFTPILTI